MNLETDKTEDAVRALLSFTLYDRGVRARLHDKGMNDRPMG